MIGYHFHHPERMFADRAELLEVIAAQRLMTLAMAREGQPYLITVSYGFDPEQDCFYFHCAPEGKKIAYLVANPNVWGQVVEDRGYVTGKCDHAYRSIHFGGRVAFLEAEDEKREALTLMIRKLEPNPEPLIERLMTQGRLAKTTVGRVRVTEMTGKRHGLELLAQSGGPM
jgi:uncharacterized protein